MDNRDIRKLSRSDLLEMLVEISKENDRLKEELAEANKKLENRVVAAKEAGSIAEASLKLNGVFEAAEKAAEDYLYNIKIMEKAKIKEMKEIHRLYKKMVADEQRREENNKS